MWPRGRRGRWYVRGVSAPFHRLRASGCATIARCACLMLLAAACGDAPTVDPREVEGDEVATSGARPPVAPARRVVLITFDTLRADGLHPRRMPRTWAWAQQGARFDRFYAASSATQPTHASLFTGLHPWEHGVARNGIALAPQHETVAERLAREGFATAGVVASFALDRRFALDQGFERYEQEFEHRLVHGAWEGEEVDGQRFYGLGEAVVARALAELDALGGPLQFFWLHLFDPHEPYGDAAGGDVAFPSRIRQLASLRELTDDHLRYARRLYHDDLRALDAALAPFYERLQRDAEHVETHVVLTSDHGESFGEDGSFTHGYRVSPEQVHVPLVVVSPRVPAGVRHDVAGSRDVARTLLSLAGVSADGFAGRDLLRAPPGGDGAEGGVALGMSGQFGTTPELRTDGREVDATRPRYFQAGEDGLLTGDADVVRRDDREDFPIDDERAAPLRARFAEYERSRLERAAPLVTDPATTDALRALGYYD